MKKLFLIALLILPCKYIDAQEIREAYDSRPLNSINLNILGDASMISVNYERFYPIKQNMLMAAKLGVGYNEEFNLCIYGPCREPYKYLTVPHHLTFNFGHTKHFFELGLGGTVISGNTTQPYILYPIVGYRFQSFKKKLNFRIFVQYPFSGGEIDDILFIPMGVCIGKTF